MAFCALALGAAGVQRRPETVFAASTLARLTWPVAYTLHLGEINLNRGCDGRDRPAAPPRRRLVAGDRHRSGRRDQLTPLIFVVFLLITGRVRAAITAAGTFAATIALGAILLPSPSRGHTRPTACSGARTGSDPANPSNQSLAGAVARLASPRAPPSDPCVGPFTGAFGVGGAGC